MCANDPEGEFAMAYTPIKYHAWTANDIAQLRKDVDTYKIQTGGNKGYADIRFISTLPFYTSRGL